MSVPTHCKKCGYRGIARAIHIENSVGIKVSGSETCPQCGGSAEFQKGTYDFVGATLSAFRAAETSRQTVEDVSEILTRVASGKISETEAIKQTNAISRSIGEFLRAAREHGVTFDRVLAVVAILLTVWTSYSSDEDAKAALGALQDQTAISRKNLENSEKLMSELKAVNASLRELSLKPALQHADQVSNGALKNRQQRLKEAAIKRRKRN